MRRIFPLSAGELYYPLTWFRNTFRRFKGHLPLDSIAEQEFNSDHQLDITTDTCPMTFVRTRLALDRMQSGQTLLLRLRGEEPRRNLPRTAREQGHAVLAERELADGTMLLLLRKG
ncbi:sulfurtransferase TusA family protein [Roseicella sp. DB1501]|uniref:sulfurtransferase TusA family protein n=1 Tax=Roseicella sp. DB1501 TaxID=2730925 RepID=UPI0014920254|nr:sulfurtransferase TusA family protein [Roseicella sp. DB1501]